MVRGRAMILNTVLLTATSFFMRSVGMAFQVYLSKKIGASGIGLFQLIMSVSMLSTAFALSGIRFATTRLVSEELGRGLSVGVKHAVRRCLIYSACFGCAAMAAMWFGATFIGQKIIGDGRTVLSLRLLALSLPAFSASAVLAGYFTAVSRVIKSAAVQVVEQLIRIAVIVAALSLGRDMSLETSCAMIIVGGIAGEIASFLLLYILYIDDRRRYPKSSGNGAGLTKRMLNIALPLALTAYARTALSTVQNLLVPRGFKKSGSSAEKALADYGIVQGMVFPIIMFPSAFFYSLAELLVPELTEAQMRGEKPAIAAITNRTLRLCLLFSIGVAAILFRFSGELGDALYKNADVGYYIRVLSLLMPIMYLDSVTDGMLRGLGEQMYTMKVNIIDSLVSVLMVYILLPKYAVMGYLFMIGFTEIFNFGFSIIRLSKLTRLKLSLNGIIKAVFCGAGSVNISVFLLRTVGLPLKATAGSVTVHIALTAVFYAAGLVVLSCIDKSDILWFKKLLGFNKIFKNNTLKRKEKGV